MHNSRNVRSGSIAVSGTRLYYDELGEGPTLVLIPGGYMDRHVWDDQFEAFATHYHVIRYDIRGFGESPRPQEPYTDRHDLYELLTHLGVQRTSVLGLSLGGIIAVEFTLEHPEIVETLILVGAPVPGYPPQQLLTLEELDAVRARQEPFAAATRARDLPRMVEALMANPTFVPSPAYPEARERVRRQLSAYSFTWVLDHVEQAPLTPPAYTRLAEITMPTLLVVGTEDDLYLQRSADVFAREIAQVQRVNIAGTHHIGPNMEKPDEFNQIVLEFLAAHAPPVPGA